MSAPRNENALGLQGWRCGCGYTDAELRDAELRGVEVCVCGLNPYTAGTWRRFPDRGGTRCVRVLRAPMALRVLGRAGPNDRGGAGPRGAGPNDRVLGVRVGELASLCGRWTVQMLIPVVAMSTAEVVHRGEPFRFVRNGDVLAAPWLETLIRGGVVYCVDDCGGVWALIDALELDGAGQPIEFWIGHAFPFFTSPAEA